MSGWVWESGWVWGSGRGAGGDDGGDGGGARRAPRPATPPPAGARPWPSPRAPPAVAPPRPGGGTGGGARAGAWARGGGRCRGRRSRRPGRPRPPRRPRSRPGRPWSTRPHRCTHRCRRPCRAAVRRGARRRRRWRHRPGRTSPPHRPPRRSAAPAVRGPRPRRRAAVSVGFAGAAAWAPHTSRVAWGERTGLGLIRRRKGATAVGTGSGPIGYDRVRADVIRRTAHLRGRAVRHQVKRSSRRPVTACARCSAGSRTARYGLKCRPRRAQWRRCAISTFSSTPTASGTRIAQE